MLKFSTILRFIEKTSFFNGEKEDKNRFFMCFICYYCFISINHKTYFQIGHFLPQHAVGALRICEGLVELSELGFKLLYLKMTPMNYYSASFAKMDE